MQSPYISHTYDPIMDMSLSINHASSVETALKQSITPEILDGDEKIKCPMLVPPSTQSILLFIKKSNIPSSRRIQHPQFKQTKKTKKKNY